MSNIPAPNPNIPQIPQPLSTLDSLTYAMQALKQGLDSLAGYRGQSTDRAVTFNDLIQYRLLDAANVVSNTGSATFTAGTVTQIDTTGGIHGGPIKSKGTLSVDWNGGTVEVLGAHLTLTSGTLDAVPGITHAVTAVVAGAGLTGGTITTSGTIVADWQAGSVAAVAGMQLNGGTLQANWRLPVITTLGSGLVRQGPTLDTSLQAKSLWAPAVTGETPGPILVSTPDGQCVMVPIA